MISMPMLLAPSVPHLEVSRLRASTGAGWRGRTDRGLGCRV